MAHERSMKLLSLGSISQRCAQETDLFFRRQDYDPRYCFELFRRAILHNNERAWEFVFHQYRPLVTSWVKRHSAFSSTGEEVQYFVNRAFERMWSALTPEKFDRFSNLKAVLSYLQLCVHSAIIDAVRLAGPTTVDIDQKPTVIRGGTPGSSIEALALQRAQNEELWRLIGERMGDEKERLVVYGSFVLALKPRQLHSQFQGSFESVQEIYRIKQNVLARLRRDRALKEFLGDGA